MPPRYETEVFNNVCELHDVEIVTTEEVLAIACLLFNGPELDAVFEEIEVLEVCMPFDYLDKLDGI